MKKKLAVLVLAAATLVAVPLAHAQRGPGSHPMGGGAYGPGTHPMGGGPHGPGMGEGFGGGFAFFGHLAHLQSELGLTDQQVAQIRVVADELHVQNDPLRDQMHDGLKNIAQALITNPDDTAAAQALIDQQTAVERTMKTNMINGVSKALKILTAEQRVKLATLLAERAQRWENRGH